MSAGIKITRVINYDLTEAFLKEVIFSPYKDNVVAKLISEPGKYIIYGDFSELVDAPFEYEEINFEAGKIMVRNAADFVVEFFVKGNHIRLSPTLFVGLSSAEEVEELKPFIDQGLLEVVNNFIQSGYVADGYVELTYV